MWLAILAGANVIISLYYYLSVIRRVYANPPVDAAAIAVGWPVRIAIMACLGGTVFLGIWQGPFVDWATRAALTLF